MTSIFNLSSRNLLLVWLGLVVVLLVVIAISFRFIGGIREKLGVGQAPRVHVDEQPTPGFPEYSGASAYQHSLYGFRFTSPADWDFFNVGLPVEGSTMISTREETPTVIYLHHPEFTSVMDLHVQKDYSSSNLQKDQFTEYTTKRSYQALLHVGDCGVFDEPQIYLENNPGQSLFVEVDELCEEEEWENVDLEPLVKELADGFEFVNE